MVGFSKFVGTFLHVSEEYIEVPLKGALSFILGYIGIRRVWGLGLPKINKLGIPFWGMPITTALVLDPPSTLY